MKFVSIQAMRGIAASSVVLYHIDNNLFSFGWAGVDLFFVISGFIMGTIGLNERPSEFIMKRIIRVVPLYWSLTLLLCLLSATTNVFSRFTFTIYELSYSLFFIPYRGDTGDVWPLLIPGWTLNFEMFFYLIFSAALLTKKTIPLTAVTLSALVALGATISFDSPALQIWTSPLLLEFLGGLIVAAIPPKLGYRGSVVVMLLGTMGYFLSASLSMPEDMEPWHRVLGFGVSSVLFLAGNSWIERAGRWPRWLRPLGHLGDISYSLYLIHSIVIAAAHKLLGGGALFAAASLTASLAISEASYRLIEVRMTRILRHLLKKAA